MKIKVKKITKSIKDLVAIREQVYKMPSTILFTDHEGELIKNLVAIFEFEPLQEAATIEKKVRLITSKVYREKKLKPATLPKIVANTSINQFLFYVIGFKILPHAAFYDLYQTVVVDLKGLLTLIERYEKEPMIMEFLAGNLRGEHEAMVRIEYYKRCINERDLMLKYLSDGIYLRALSNCCEPFKPSILDVWGRENRNLPYFFRNGRTLEYFDYTQINIYRHRIEDLDHGANTSKVVELGFLHESGKLEKFYEVLNKLKPVTELFHKIRQLYSRTLPILHQRIAILQELEELFIGEKWYGFSALALIQVEGLYSDMMSLGAPGKSAGSLSMKVRAIRQFYPYYRVGIDYFEFQVPRIRNRLLHFGNLPEHDFRILSWELAYDLWCLLDFSLLLSDPSTRLNGICNSVLTPEYVEATGLVKIFDYVKLVQEQVKRNPQAKVQKDILKKWERFRSDLAEENGLVDLVRDMRVILRGDIQRSFAAVKKESEMLSRPIDLESLTPKEVSDRKNEIALIIDELSWEVKEGLGEIYHSLRFLHCYKTYLPECTETAIKTLDAVKDVHRGAWAKLQQFKEVIDEFGFSHTVIF